MKKSCSVSFFFAKNHTKNLVKRPGLYYYGIEVVESGTKWHISGKKWGYFSKTKESLLQRI